MDVHDDSMHIKKGYRNRVSVSCTERYYWVEVGSTSNSQNGNTGLLTEESICQHIKGIVVESSEHIS